MKINSAIASDVGKKRARNEDSYLINGKLGLYVVADGMGGHSGGQFASQMAVMIIEENVNNMIADPEATVIDGVNSAEASPENKLCHAIRQASERIFERAQYDASLKGMGTTTVACLFDKKVVYVAHVGDSRVYFFHANKMRQVTKDHSLVTEQIDAGMISKSDAKTHKLKNIITRSVGYQETVDIDVQTLDLHMGDKFLLCSDGLTNTVDDGTIEKMVKQAPSLQNACDGLIELANKNGGEDNITVLLTEVIDIE